MADIVHYPIGLSVIRDAMEIPDWLHEEILERSQREFDIQYQVADDGTVYQRGNDNPNSNEFRSLEHQSTVPTRFQPHDERVESSGRWKEFWREACDAQYQGLLTYCEKYTMLLSQIWWSNRGHVLCYGKGGFLGGHHDNDIGYSYETRDDVIGFAEAATRNVVSTTLHLCDTDGGNLVFPYVGEEIETKAGDLLVFPANYIGAHWVTTIKSGHRMSYLTWYGQGSSLGLNAGTDKPHVIHNEDRLDANQFVWCESPVEDFMEHSGWSHEQMKAAFPSFDSRGTPEFWQGPTDDNPY